MGDVRYTVRSLFGVGRKRRMPDLNGFKDLTHRVEIDRAKSQPQSSQIGPRLLFGSGVQIDLNLQAQSSVLQRGFRNRRHS